MIKEFMTKSPEETIELAKEIGSRMRGGEIICYKGGLGVGKTTFTRGLSLGMGLGDEVTSPTFALVNEYRGDKYHGKGLSLIHFDMYRINGGADLETTGFFDYMDENAVLAVEWSENIIGELGEEDIITVTIERIDDNTRKITLQGDERFAVLRC